jgi:hypothetical protein
VRADLDRRRRHAGCAQARQADDRRARGAAAHLGDRLQAAHARHRHVQQDDVGLQLGRGLDAGYAVGGLADDLDRRILGQRRAHQRPEALGVVAQQDTDRKGGSHVLHIIGW